MGQFVTTYLREFVSSCVLCCPQLTIYVSWHPSPTCGDIPTCFWQYFITLHYHLSFQIYHDVNIPFPGHTLLLENVQKVSQSAIYRDSNTHIETFGDHSDIFYPEFSFHMKHIGYFSPTINSYMVSLKYDFGEFRSKHWLYTDALLMLLIDSQSFQFYHLSCISICSNYLG